MINGRDEAARLHGGENPFEFLPHGLFAEMHDAFVITAEENSVWIAFTEIVDINARHVFKREDAFDARFAEPCETVANISIRID